MMRARGIFLLPLTLAACSDADGASSPPISPYSATAVGRVDSIHEARQLVAAADGIISRLLVERGESVRAGQPLLRVDCAARLANYDASAAEAQRSDAAAQTVRSGSRPQEIVMADEAVYAARARQEDAHQRFDQASKLIDRGFISKRELELRQNNLAEAEATLSIANSQSELTKQGSRNSEIAAANAAARAAYGNAKASKALSEQCNLNSPIDGTILQILRREGEFSGASQGVPLIVVGDLSKLAVRAEINERDAVTVRTGQRAEVWIDGQQRRWRGRVTALTGIMGRRTARSLDPTDRFDRDTREVIISFDEAMPPPLVGLRVMVGLVR